MPQFKSVNSLALSLLYGPTLTSLHDYWKNQSFDRRDLGWQGNVSAFSQVPGVRPRMSLQECPPRCPCRSLVTFSLAHAQLWVHHFQITRGSFWPHLNYDLANLTELTTQRAVLNESSQDVSWSGASFKPGSTRTPEGVILKTYTFH